MQDPTTNKDVVGSIDTQSQLAKSLLLNQLAQFQID